MSDIRATKDEQMTENKSKSGYFKKQSAMLTISPVNMLPSAQRQFAAVVCSLIC